ncbi:MAG: pyridoxal-dependent decarboxylase, partial [Holophagales bacterium]|nr:pyridoxal-dependent decarboxylase [Holophagales bacterium]
REGVGAEVVIHDMLHHVAPYPAGHAHPRFWGWVCGTGTPIGMVADLVAAGINASCGTFDDAPTRVEDQVLAWMRELFSFPEGSSGILTSGGSVANLIGLAVARDAVLGDEVRRWGLSAVGRHGTVYASEQVHSSVDKGVQLLGLGLDSLRKVPVDGDYRIRLDALEEMLDADRAAGLTPFALVANAGTVNTGAIDDLEALADLAERESLWLHVDGAIGALAMLSPELRPRFRGIERASSLAFDFHKWLYVPYEAGCVLVRDAELHRRTFSVAASYLEPPPRGIGARPDSSYLRGPQLSRGFKALKVWAQIREHGFERLGRMLAQNVAQVERLTELVDAEPALERLAPVGLNIVCFRYHSPESPERTDEGWDALNKELLMRLQERGIAAPSSTVIGGRFALRVANTNQRARREDFELLVREVVRLGRELEAEG